MCQIEKSGGEGYYSGDSHVAKQRIANYELIASDNNTEINGGYRL